MRLGGPVFHAEEPKNWAQAHRLAGYRAAYFPLNENASDVDIKGYVDSARKDNLIIAEVGAWSNPLSSDHAVRAAAIKHCQASLDLADRAQARCCVNIAGSRGEQWDGPHPDNLSQDVFDLIVETVRDILDAVNPKHTFYTLETMPWVFPDSADSYLDLIRAIDRDRFAVHFDPVNLINCPSRYYDTPGLLRDAFQKLGPYIRSCHAKDIALSTRLTVHLDEVPVGQGGLDYAVYLAELSKLSDDTPLMMEHMAEDQYPVAAEYIRTTASAMGIEV